MDRENKNQVDGIRSKQRLIGQIVCVAALLLGQCHSAISAGNTGKESTLSFEARTISGERIQVAPRGASDDSTPQLTVVCFLGAECPMARIYGPRLTEIAAQFPAGQVQVIGIDSNRQDSFADIRDYVDELGISFPFVHDKDNLIADQFGASRTPEVFLLDRHLAVRYHGRIDDQYAPGINRSKPQRRDLLIAIQELLAGRAVSVPETTALGCLIGRVTKKTTIPPVQNDITYSKHVVPVLQKHCVECHRAGEIGPFAMDSYGEVAGWADTMLETIDNGRMPPWHANPKYGRFQNARHMPESDRQILRDWVAGGLKPGDPARVPSPVEVVDGWQLQRQPDLVLDMRDRPYLVPKDGVVEYQYFVVDPGFTQDKWVTGAQVVPGSRSVVHHAIVFVRPPDGERFRGVGWLSAYVPGQRMMPLPEGRARRIPAGSKLVFQMHYTPNGKPQQDLSRVGLVFTRDEDVTHEIFTLIALNQEFEIPPHAAEHPVRARVRSLPRQGELLAVTPHMHYRGTSFRLFSDPEDTSILLDVPNYDFNWQHTYAFAEPIPLAGLEQLRFEAVFNNSADNPFNPDADQWVTWGDQTWEEMAVAFFEVAEPRNAAKAAASVAVTGSTDGPERERELKREREREQKINAWVTRALTRMDADNDGQISKDEAPIVVRHFNFRRFDLNGDDVATEEELREIAAGLY
ncbi:MAG: redoxin domain-containing protein [Fuerstiella sp.]